MREDLPMEPCEGCGAGRAVVAVESLLLSGARYRVEIHHPHASCGASAECGYVLVAEDRILIATRPARRTTPSRRRS